MKKMMLVGIVALCGCVVQGAIVQYSISADDFGELFIDGVSVAKYDDYPAGGVYTALLDLTEGWHDMAIVYKNRWGSNALVFQSVSEAGAWAPVPLADMRSQNAQGTWINGLKADYYNLSGTYLKTLYGEGPIEHGARWANNGQLLTYYQSVWPDPWAGSFNGWSTFEERLSGQILVGNVPEPATMSLLALGSLVMMRKRK